jgi:hypothetical protein
VLARACARASPRPCCRAGNGRSEKPRLLGRKGRWWTIDDNIDQDLPALVRFVRLHTGAAQVGGQAGGAAREAADAAAPPRACVLAGWGGCSVRAPRGRRC